jgi:hypothetical protein
VASIKVVVALPAIMLLTWLGVEMGFALRAYAQAKTAADAVALAAAARYPDGHEAALQDALAAAAANNGPNGPVLVQVVDGKAGGGDVLFGDWDEATRQFTPQPEGGRAVRVRVRFAADHPNGPVGLVLGGLFESGPFSVERSSVAVHRPARHTTSLLALDPGSGAISLTGESRLRSEGGVSLASNDARALSVSGYSELVAPIVRIAGDLGPDSEARVEGRIAIGYDVPADPKAAVPLPAWGPGPAQAIGHDNVSLTRVMPGLHAGLVASGGRIVLAPGLHQFDGPIVLSGTAELYLEGATLQLGDFVGVQMTGSSRMVADPMVGLTGWGRTWLLQRGLAAIWQVSESARIDASGRCYAPTTEFVFDGQSKADLGPAILSKLEQFGLAEVDFRERLAELDEEPEPGRASLVR